MTVCFMQQELQTRGAKAPDADLDQFLDEVQTLLGKIR